MIGGQRWWPNVAALSGGLYDDFSGAAPANWWTTLLGTMATNAGALRANAIASDTYNMVLNPEFTTDTIGWGGGSGSTIARVDSAVDPGVASTTASAADDWCLKVTNTAGTDGKGIYSTTGGIIGATYQSMCIAYAPSANVVVNAARLRAVDGGSTVAVTAEDAWRALTITGITPIATPNVAVATWGATATDITYHDKVAMYLQSTIAYGNLYTPNAMITASMISPAALVTPRAVLLRVTDALNYVRLLLLPNTAGNDTTLETVTAGVRATVQTADVDWTPGGTDKVRVLVQGNNYTVQHMKAGAAIWTNAFTTATASFNTNTLFGLQVFVATDNSWDDILIQPA
ncbi:MAG: hypothetical protein WC565_05045 [Parcubacteria group bacterium]